MAITQNYFYDQQLRRWIVQFMRLFSGFSVKMGKDANDSDFYHQVPVRYGDTSRMAQHIIRKNSENTISSVPAISCYISELAPASVRRINPSFQTSTQVGERVYDETHGQFVDQVAENYTLDRTAPVPYDLTFNVDVWSSNTEQKLQLLEQLLLLFNPSVNLQSSNNPYDWTSLAVVELTNITWSSRTIPQGTDDAIDVATLVFSLPIFLTPPAKVKRQVLIHSIINNLNVMDATGALDSFILNEGYHSSRMWITFEDRHIRVTNDTIQLLNKDHNTVDAVNNGTLSWAEHFGKHGGIKNGITEIILKLGDELNPFEVFTRVTIVPGNSNILSYDIDTATLPPDTLLMVNGVINPSAGYPGTGNLPLAAQGQRYLVMDELSQGSMWSETLTANSGDIIEYNGSDWVLSFDASTVTTSEYTTNANSMKKLHFNGIEWVLALEGLFEEGRWRIVN